MDNLDLIDEISGPLNDEPKHLEGLPRRCGQCGTWSRHKKPKKNNGCFTVKCPSCHKNFEVVIGMKGSRK